MRFLLFIILLPGFFQTADAQKYITRDGYISFFSSTPLEDIKADNNQVASVLDISNGDIVFQVLISSFRFEKTLMQQHFNESYLESDKFPRSTFTGKITNISSIDFKKNGTYDVTVEGDLTMRDVTRKVSARGTIEVASGSLIAESKFNISPEDYGVKIPAVVRNKIATIIEVTVRMRYAPQ
jgi:hypothetical protein